MPAYINEAPFNTPLQSIIRRVTNWATWFESVRLALARPTAVATLNFPNTAAQSSSDLTVTFADGEVTTDDVAHVSPPNGSVMNDSCYTAWVSAADTVKVRFNNYSAIAKNPASGDFTVVVFKR